MFLIKAVINSLISMLVAYQDWFKHIYFVIVCTIYIVFEII